MGSGRRFVAESVSKAPSADGGDWPSGANDVEAFVIKHRGAFV
jgi:hypothetical protein